jgi:hypothetical protein
MSYDVPWFFGLRSFIPGIDMRLVAAAQSLAAGYRRGAGNLNKWIALRWQTVLVTIEIRPTNAYPTPDTIAGIASPKHPNAAAGRFFAIVRHGHPIPQSDHVAPLRNGRGGPAARRLCGGARAPVTPLAHL